MESLSVRRPIRLLLFYASGAHERARTADLVLTKDVLYHLSYVSETRLLLPNLFFIRFVLHVGAGNGIRTRDPELGRLVL